MVLYRPVLHETVESYLKSYKMPNIGAIPDTVIFLWMCLCLLPGLRAEDRHVDPIGNVLYRPLLEGGKFVTAVAADEKGGLWVGSEDRGLSYFDGVWWHVPEIPYQDEFPVSAEMDDGQLCLGFSRSGVGVLNGKGEWKFHSVLNGLAAHRVDGLLWRSGGGLWIGSETGLWSLGKPWNFHGTPGDPITCLVEWKGSIAFGTTFSGVWAFGRDGMRKLPDQGLPDRRIYDLTAGTDGALWAGTFSGLAVLKDEKWEAVRIPFKERTQEEVLAQLVPQSKAILSLEWDGEGSLWVGTRTEGIYRYFPGEKRSEKVGAHVGLINAFVPQITFDRDGFPVIGTNGEGVYQLESPILHFKKGDEDLCCHAGKVLSSRGWVYSDRGNAKTLGEFLLGRRLRAVQTDSQGEFLCLYFDGLDQISTIPGRHPPGIGRGAVLLDSQTGKSEWFLPALPVSPVRWSPGAKFIAFQSKLNEIRVYSADSGKEAFHEFSEKLESFFFESDGSLVVIEKGAKASRWKAEKEGLVRVTQPEGQKTGSVPNPLISFERTPTGPDVPIPGIKVIQRNNEFEGIPSETLRVVHTVTDDTALKAGKALTVKAPKGDYGAVSFFCFQYKDLEPNHPELLPFDISIKTGSRSLAYFVDEHSEAPRPVNVCIPFPLTPGIEITVTSRVGRPLGISKARLLTTNPRFLKAEAVKARIDEEKDSPPQFSLGSPALYSIAPQRSDLLANRRPHGKNELDFLFDGDLKSVWTCPPDMLGWGLEVEFGAPIQLRGVVALGEPGVLSKQMEGISLELWKESTTPGGRGIWTMHSARENGRQFQYSVFSDVAVSKFRVSGLSQTSSLAELIVLVSPKKKT